MSDQRPSIDFVFRITNTVLWNTFRKNEIGDVMLPFVLLRRLDCMLEPNKTKVREAYLNFKDKVLPDKLGPILQKSAGGLTYYNTSQYDLKTLTGDARNIEINFRAYLQGFSPNVTEILDNYQMDKVVARLVKNGLLFMMVQEIAKEDFHRNAVSNHDMGYIFEEIIRISNEQSNETAGEHFTPREVIRLMASLVFCTEYDELRQPGVIRTIYDMACGTGGMLSISKNYVLENINENAILTIFGQEINEQSYAIAKSDLLITGENPENIKHGNSFTEDGFLHRRFNYMLANPPYGVSWKKDEEKIKREALNPLGRFSAGLPRSSDGQLLFIQHMISKMDEQQGSRIAVITNGSPLFTGDAGSGESEIRRWIIGNDWLEAIIALPSELFYNTGIFTYIWLLTNKKPAHRQGKVQLINATDQWVAMKKSLNNKRKRISDAQIEAITELYKNFEEGPQSKIFDNDAFGYFQLTIERPERDAAGAIVRDKKGQPKPDGKKRDTENVPLGQDIEAYFAREVRPHVPDAWVNYAKTRIGYEINFTRYFYEYKKPDTAAGLKAKILKLEDALDGLLAKVLND